MDEPATVTVRFKPTEITPTRELVERIRSLTAGGVTCFEYAQLRPGDGRWWLSVTEGIIADLEATMRNRAADDETLLAELPQDAYKGAYGDDARRAVELRFLASRRRGGAWVFHVGMMLRDAERIFVEGINHGPKVLRARGQLRAFAVAIAMELKCAEPVRSAYASEGDHG